VKIKVKVKKIKGNHDLEIALNPAQLSESAPNSQGEKSKQICSRISQSTNNTLRKLWRPTDAFAYGQPPEPLSRPPNHPLNHPPIHLRPRTQGTRLVGLKTTQPPTSTHTLAKKRKKSGGNLILLFYFLFAFLPLAVGCAFAQLGRI